MIHGVYGGAGIRVHYNGPTGGMNVQGSFADLGQGRVGEIRVLGNTTYAWSNGGWNIIGGGGSETWATVELTSEVQTLLDWARRAMRREQELEKLVAEYPSVKSAKEHLDIVVALTRDYSQDK